MNLSGKKKSAVIISLSLAKTFPNPYDAFSISLEQGISISYIEQVMAFLRRGKLVTGIRGPGGGYVLARHPSKINVAEIVDCIDDNLDEPFKDKSIAIAIERFGKEQREFLKSISLAFLIS
jgi:Rrf2 family iron-sulfur cluster assembly transcriptional regulator